MKCLMKAGCLGIGEAKVKGILTYSRYFLLADIITSVYESMFIDKADMIDLLINTVLPKFDDEESSDAPCKAAGETDKIMKWID